MINQLNCCNEFTKRKKKVIKVHSSTRLNASDGMIMLIDKFATLH